MDTESALGTIFGNTKRHKRVVDLLTLSECFDFLLKIYGNQEEVAKQTDLSREMVREFLQIQKLPEFVKAPIRSRKIDSIDTAYRLTKITDETALRSIVDKLSILKSHDVRDVISVTREKLNTSVNVATEIVLAAKPKNVHLFLIDFPEETYSKLVATAVQLKCSPADLVKNMVSECLDEKMAK
jgi:hypothetical protein